MPVISCPYCGTTTNASLKFCVSCGRSVGELERKLSKLNVLKPGITKQLDLSVTQTNFLRARKSYTAQRTMRSLLLGVCLIIALFLASYAAFQYAKKNYKFGTTAATSNPIKASSSSPTSKKSKLSLKKPKHRP